MECHALSIGLGGQAATNGLPACLETLSCLQDKMRSHAAKMAFGTFS